MMGVLIGGVSLCFLLLFIRYIFIIFLFLEVFMENRDALFLECAEDILPEEGAEFLEIYLDCCTEEEKSLILGRGFEVEEELCLQVGLFAVRERRLLRDMERAREEGREIPQLMKLEDSLSSVQNKKTRSLLALNEVRGKKAKLLSCQEEKEVDLTLVSDEMLEQLGQMLED